MKRRVTEALSLVGMAGFSKEPARLSGGQSEIGYCRSCCLAMNILILDEGYNIGSEGRLELIKIVKRFVKDRK